MNRIIIIVSCFLLCQCASKQKELHIKFDNVEGLVEGSEVKINGVVVGVVKKMSLTDNNILVTTRLEKDVVIKKESTATILKPLVGNEFVSLELSQNAALLSDMDTLIGKYKEEKVFEKLSADTATQRKIKDALEKIKTGIEDLIKAKKDSL